MTADLDAVAAATRHLAAYLDNRPTGQDLAELVCQHPMVAALVLDLAITALRDELPDPLSVYTDTLRLAVLEHEG